MERELVLFGSRVGTHMGAHVDVSGWKSLGCNNTANLSAPVGLLSDGWIGNEATAASELIDLAIDRFRNLPVLAVITFRSEFHAPWIGLSNVASLVLGRLSSMNANAIILQMTGRRVLPVQVTKTVLEDMDHHLMEPLMRTLLAEIDARDGRIDAAITGLDACNREIRPALLRSGSPPRSRRATAST
jgi:hypothetical protein